MRTEIRCRLILQGPFPVEMKATLRNRNAGGREEEVERINSCTATPWERDRQGNWRGKPESVREEREEKKEKKRRKREGGRIRRKEEEEGQSVSNKSADCLWPDSILPTTFWAVGPFWLLSGATIFFFLWG